MFHGKGIFYKRGEYWLHGSFHEGRPRGMVKIEAQPKGFREGDRIPYVSGKFSALKVISIV